MGEQLQQNTNYTCGPAALRYIFDKYGLKLSEEKITKGTGASKENGVDPSALAVYAKKKGFWAESLTHPNGKRFLKFLYAVRKLGFSVIVDYSAGDLYEDGHYVVFLGLSNGKIKVWDPALGKDEFLTKDYFISHWKDILRSGKKFKNLAILIDRG